MNEVLPGGPPKSDDVNKSIMYEDGRFRLHNFKNARLVEGTFELSYLEEASEVALPCLTRIARALNTQSGPLYKMKVFVEIKMCLNLACRYQNESFRHWVDLDRRNGVMRVCKSISFDF